MKVDLSELKAFLAVARAKGFREGARVSGSSASGLSVAVSRLEEQLGVRLLHRTTRSVVLTEAGNLLLERLGPALTEIESALDPVNVFRDKPAGTLRLNVNGSEQTPRWRIKRTAGCGAKQSLTC
jgi:DNA-binding transcriptional LysR family regulator